MMEDWTDIIGEELESVEVPLPADDWDVLQQKHAAFRRKKRTALFAWSGGLAGAAAALALVLLLFSPEPVHEYGFVLADDMNPADVVVPADTAAVEVPSEVHEAAAPAGRRKPQPAAVQRPADDVLTADMMEEPEEEPTEETFDVIRDTVPSTGDLLADASPESETYEQSWEDDESMEEPRRKRIPVSIGLSGSMSGRPMLDMVSMDAEIPKDPDYGLSSPTDSAFVEKTEPSSVMMRKKSGYSDSYTHDVPVSFGVSARFFLTGRLTFNTGLNYTRYSSTRERYYHSGRSERDRQYVHYLGIPLRLDWMIVNRKAFSLYAGAGVQMDKCVYASVGEERLHEKEVLFGLNGAMGLQVNILPRVGLYFEPDVSYALNEGSLQTFRAEEHFMFTARAGLRFTF